MLVNELSGISTTTNRFCGTDVTARILIVDDYAPWRQKVRSLLQRHPGLELVGEAADGLEALQKVLEAKPDLVLLDIGLPRMNGIEASAKIRRAAPGVTILFLSQNADVDVLQAALNNGAKGYVFKMDAAQELWPAIKAVLSGNQFLSSGIKQRISVESGATLVLAPGNP